VSRLRLKFGEPVEEPLPRRPGFGKTLAECRTLAEVAEYTRLAERAMTEGKIDHMSAKCPHCHRKIGIGLIDGLIAVPDGPGDPVSKVGKVASCPHTTTGCGRQFKLDPPPGHHFEVWP